MQRDYALLHTKATYRSLFEEARQEVNAHLRELRGDYRCDQCQSPPEPGDDLHEGCGYRPWLVRCVEVLENEYGRVILESLDLVHMERNRIGCHQCGLCCRLASSEHNWEELRQRAEAGDDFAAQFTSVFLPYPSREAAMEKFPDLVAQVEREAGDDVHFYHCPFVGEDNRCTIFGDPRRPAICATYPETPLTFVQKNCAWKPWKDANHDDSLRLHALIECCTHLSEKMSEQLAG